MRATYPNPNRISTMAGITSCSGSKPFDMVLVAGNQPSNSTKTNASSTALANSGIDVVRMENSEITRSRALPSFMPARTPATIDSGTMTPNTTAARMPVLARRGHSTSATGTRYFSDWPKSPVTMPPSQSK